MSEPFAARLAARTARVGSVLCLGLDPDPAGLPPGFSPDVAGVERFAALVLDAGLPWVAAVKANLAFFEAFGSAGLAALERLRARIPADVPFVADAKRGDIGSTAARHAAALYDGLGADAVTASPYLGSTAIAPLLEREDRFVYLLCRTSNEGAGDIQDLVVGADLAAGWPAEAVHRRVARLAEGWSAHYGTIGLVVGATAPRELAAIRETAPGLPFLVPGLGAQGGDEAAVLASGGVRDGPWAERPGHGLLVSVSRGIAGAARATADPEAAVSEAAAGWSARLAVLR
ncbi:MAG TPA: orotidine-5'-phosphate decarboxylase [Candidatus Limnocylindrales bacterium]|nr:orotidine-5'-phosphate decarboxylase [Candidatus Limnocylindrales bacterium]